MRWLPRGIGVRWRRPQSLWDRPMPTKDMRAVGRQLRVGARRVRRRPRLWQLSGSLHLRRRRHPQPLRVQSAKLLPVGGQLRRRARRVWRSDRMRRLYRRANLRRRRTESMRYRFL